jgi:hypothetical protein
MQRCCIASLCSSLLRPLNAAAAAAAAHNSTHKDKSGAEPFVAKINAAPLITIAERKLAQHAQEVMCGMVDAL